MKFMYAATLAVAVGGFGLLGAESASATSLHGKWVGSGIVKPKEGKKEKMRCRVSYTKETDAVYAVTAACSTASLKVHQSGQVLKVGKGRYRGEFYNEQWGVSGKVRVVVNGGRQKLSITSSAGTGSMSLRKR